ncbi:hypothetical protein SODALDRAFT_79071 [Sodiomyces alkalinus F11]|uniref:Zn(2)-C6 fungal-type domain-containing protein n=1 Tax=Sodiomyces alkalinus (strain CBS 110278 / VKM F-3762 / F11) TaxID=1314773 RepID=A0A3N2PKY7_SODAK|nr:hypothetical protein SODALDRAFT_79071 [Sodiomyces alkalinus F11]ROT35182.1 hypothetical protein SODALDRAFT_79071 [Sodiomyces alkalinus F11]
MTTSHIRSHHHNTTKKIPIQTPNTRHPTPCPSPLLHPLRRPHSNIRPSARVKQKKKCDENRPECSRCVERGQKCVYEPVKPRQRKKRDSNAGHYDDEQSPEAHLPFLRLDTGTLDLPPAVAGLAGAQKEDDHDGDGPSVSMIEDVADVADVASLASPLGSQWATSSAIDSDAALVSPFDMPFHLSLQDNDDGQVDEEIVRTSPLPLPQLAVSRMARAHHHPDLAMISPAPLGSPHLEFVLPVFSEFSDCSSRRALIDHFANVLSHLIVLRETESGNPFQQLVLPLCHRSTVVQNAIFALSSAHLEHRQRGNEKGDEKSLYFHNQAIQGLARLIEMGSKANREDLLAAIMLLVYYEVLVQRGRSNIVDGHLKGAMTVMTQNDQAPTATSAFLERAFRFYDVIAALSFGKAPISTAPAAGCLHPVPNLDPLDTSPSNSVDTLLGLSTTLWPILHRLSNLLSLKNELESALAAPSLNTAKLAVLRTEFQTTSDAVESALENWRPSLPPGCHLGEFGVYDGATMGAGPSPLHTPDSAHLQSVLHNALAYRHSAFVHLYRTIHGHARNHPSVQRHTHISLRHCVATVTRGGPVAALLWPLFVAACEAVSAEDRELARQAFIAIDQRQGMTNIERGWIIVQEVWRRSDFMDGEGSLGVADLPRNVRRAGLTVGPDLWRRVSEDMGVTIVFG